MQFAHLVNTLLKDEERARDNHVSCQISPSSVHHQSALATAWRYGDMQQLQHSRAHTTRSSSQYRRGSANALQLQFMLRFIAIYANAHRRHVYALVVGPKFLKLTSCNHRIRIAALIANDRAYRAYWRPKYTSAHNLTRVVHIMSVVVIKANDAFSEKKAQSSRPHKRFDKAVRARPL